RSLWSALTCQRFGRRRLVAAIQFIDSNSKDFASTTRLQARCLRSRRKSYATIRKNMIRPFRGVHPQIPASAYVDVSAQVIGDVKLGEQSSIWCNAVLRGDMYYIRIGDRTNIQDNCVVHTRTGSHPTILEDQVTVGHSVTLHGCYVEHGALIGI